MNRRRKCLQPKLGGFEEVGGGGASPNADLAGRVFSDGMFVIRVRSVSRANPAQVILERECDGHTWSTHAGIVRLILRPGRRRAA